jgi:hypothetical protein
MHYTASIISEHPHTKKKEWERTGGLQSERTGSGKSKQMKKRSTSLFVCPWLLRMCVCVCDPRRGAALFLGGTGSCTKREPKTEGSKRKMGAHKHTHTHTQRSTRTTHGTHMQPQSASLASHPQRPFGVYRTLIMKPGMEATRPMIPCGVFGTTYSGGAKEVMMSTMLPDLKAAFMCDGPAGTEFFSRV